MWSYAKAQTVHSDISTRTERTETHAYEKDAREEIEPVSSRQTDYDVSEYGIGEQAIESEWPVRCFDIFYSLVHQ